jgi:iron complex transport system permease protein
MSEQAAPTAAARWPMVAAAVAVLAATALSLAVGTRAVPFGDVVQALLHDHPNGIAEIAVRSRIPTTVTGLLVGAALGIGGALMQGISRNALADPGLLGINAGAAVSVVLAMSIAGLQSPLAIVWFAFAGAALAVVVVFGAAAASPMGASPLTLTLAGAAFTAIALSVVSGVLIVDITTLDSFRFWQLGSLTAASWSTITTLLPFLAAGGALAVLLSGSLNALALGDDVARTLGQRVGRTRVGCALAVVLLCGTATAMAGPIGFVGLAVPHVARALAGPDYRWVVPLSALGGAAFLLVADVIGRVVARPSTIEVGIVTAIIGAPVFVTLVRRRAVGL